MSTAFSAFASMSSAAPCLISELALDSAALGLFGGSGTQLLDGIFSCGANLAVLQIGDGRVLLRQISPHPCGVAILDLARTSQRSRRTHWQVVRQEGIEPLHLIGRVIPQGQN